MHSVRKGNPWFFGMKIHSGTDAVTGYVHTITGTAANVHDIVQAHALIREDDHSVYGDSGYLGVEKRAEIREDPHRSSVDYRIAKRPSQNRTTKAYAGVNWDRKIEHEKSSIRCKVEHPFLIVKRLFQAGRTRYRDIKKNLLRYYLLFASANLVMCLRAGRQRGVLHDNGISAPFFPNFPLKRVIQEEKGAMGAVLNALLRYSL